MSTRLAFLPLCMTLSACAGSINLSPTAPPCLEMVEASGLLTATPGASRPANDSVGELAAFGDRQTGQLDKSNADKDGAHAILTTCEAWQAKARANAEHKLKHWWQRI